MKKFIIWFFIFSLAISFAAFKAKNVIAKAILINCTKSLTNLDLNIEDVNINIGGHNIAISDLKLYNPEGFEEAVMVDMPLIYIDYSLGAALRRRVHFYALKIDLRELLIVRNQKGHLNFMSIKALKESGAKAESGRRPAFNIEKLYLSIGKVVYKDYYQQQLPVVKVYNLNLKNQLFENVDDPKALVSAVLHKALMQTDIYKLINFNMNLLRENFSDVIDKGGVIIKDLSAKASQAVKDTAKDIKNTIMDVFKSQRE